MVNRIVDEDIGNIVEDPIPFEKLVDSTILITGANGMIASYMIYTLMALNDRHKYNIKILGMVRNEGKARRHFGHLLERADFSLVVSDVTERSRIDCNIDYIIHAASQADPGSFVNDPVGTLMVNTVGTVNMLELAREKRCKGFLYTSTREVYGRNITGETVKEDDFGILDCCDPRSCYPEGKRVSETLCAAYTKQHGVGSRIVRIGHTYGYGMDLHDGRVIADLMRCAVLGSDILLKSDGSKRFAITYIADTVAGVFYAFLAGNEQVYNVSNEGAVVSIGEMARILAGSGDKKMNIVYDIPAQNAPTGYSKHDFGVLDCARLRGLGYSPKYAPEDGLIRTVQAFKGLYGAQAGDL